MSQTPSAARKKKNINQPNGSGPAPVRPTARFVRPARGERRWQPGLSVPARSRERPATTPVPAAGLAPCHRARSPLGGGAGRGRGTRKSFGRILTFAFSTGGAGARAAARRRNWQTGGMNSLHSASRPGALTDQEHQDEARSATMTDPATAGSGPVVGEPCVLLKQGEIFLKGRNRQQFERMLHANVRGAVRSTGVRAELILREGVLVLLVARDGLTPAEHAA